MSTLEVCSACGATEVVRVSGIGPNELWRRASCGSERWIHFVPAELPFLPDGLAPALLAVWWSKTPPPAAEVIALRRHFSEFGSIPLNELMARIGVAPSFVIGTFAKGRAMALRDDAAESGLDLRVEVDPDHDG